MPYSPIHGPFCSRWSNFSSFTQMPTGLRQVMQRCNGPGGGHRPWQKGSCAKFLVASWNKGSVLVDVHIFQGKVEIQI